MIARLKFLAIVFAVLALVGFFVVISGVFPITASSGHWPVTRWFLEFSMERSVSTHAMGIESPPLDDERLVLKGAGHYETGCRSCHGAPDMSSPRIPQGMTPRPPDLATVVENWEPNELFYITKHGVKFTGMPAWPAQQRDDEVWAVTAFLQKLPALDSARYRQLVYGDTLQNGNAAPIEDLAEDATAHREAAQRCARCHGVQGGGRGKGAFPRLAGQSSAYLKGALSAYASGERHSGMMEPLAARLSESDMQELSQYYAKMDVPSQPAADSATQAIELGASIAKSGIPARRVPACNECHGAGEVAKNPHYPTLDGQYAPYLVQQLKLFQDRHRGGSQYAHLMHSVVDPLSKEELHAVALYYASRSPMIESNGGIEPSER